MPELRRHSGLKPKSLLEIWIFGKVGGDDLDCYKPIVFPVMGAIDRGHAAAANLFEYLVAPDALSG
jgi:hypothetical protein